MQFTDEICNSCATRVIDEPNPAPSRAARERRGERAAVLFVGLPLTVALVFAAAPLSESPLRAVPSALPAALTTAAFESRAQKAATLAPSLVLAGSGGGARAASLRRPPLTARAIVVVANGVERVDIQAP